MGCVSAKQNKGDALANAKSSQNAPHKDEASRPQAQKKPQTRQIQKPVAEKPPAEPHESAVKPPQIHVVSELNRIPEKVESGIKEALNNPISDHASGVNPNQSEVHTTNHRADVPTFDKRSLMVAGSPPEGVSQIEGVAQQMGSYIDSGISKSQNEVKSTIHHKYESALAHIAEEEEQKVNEEGVSNFAIPIRNINLNVEVKT